MRAGALGAALLSAVLLAAGCSSGGGSGASAPPTPSATSAAASPTASPVVCMNVAALRASLDELRHLTAGPNALGKLRKDLTAVKADLVAVKESAGTEWSAQISGLQTALSKLQKTLSNLGSQPSAAAAAKAVSTDVAGVTLAGSNLLAAASTRCPEATPTPSG